VLDEDMGGTPFGLGGGQAATARAP
jgi:hypothetical protein